MRVLLFLFSILFLVNCFGQTVTISDGTYGNSQTSCYAPTYGLFDYSWSSTIYYASDLGSAKAISSLAWYVDEFQSGYSQSGPYTFSSVKIYIAHTTLSGWSNINNVSGLDRPTGNNSSQGISNWTLVYDGSVTFDASNAWKTINLTTAFSYNGSSNLIIQVENWDGSYASGYPIFHYTSTSASSIRTVKYLYQDGSMPASSTDGIRSYNRPDLRIATSATSLPVELSDFWSVNNGDDNIIYWSTDTEKNSSHFNLQKMIDGNWVTISKINSSENSTQKLNYKETDLRVDNIVNYYRLEHVDINGDIKTYWPISVDNRNKTKWVVGYFNMMGQEINIQWNKPDIYLEVYNDGTVKKVFK